MAMRRDGLKRAGLAVLLLLMVFATTACSGGGGGGGGGGGSATGTSTDTSGGAGDNDTNTGTGDTSGDTAAPTGGSVSFSASTITSTSVSVTVRASDNTGVSGVYISESSVNPSASAPGWIRITPAPRSLNKTVSFTMNAPGSVGTHNRTIYVWFKDAAGNVSSRANASVSLVVSDIVEPFNASILIDDGAGETSDTTVSVSISAEDDNGITAYAVSETTDPPPTGDPGWVDVSPPTPSFSKVLDFSLEGAGTPGSHGRTVQAWYRDAAGNVSAAASDSISLVVADTAAPLSASVAFPSVSTDTTTITLDIAASDDVGITGYHLSEDPAAPAANAPGWQTVTASADFAATVDFTIAGAADPGSHDTTVYAWFRDAAGNVSAAPGCPVTLVVADTTNPNDGGIAIDNDNDTTYTTSVTISLDSTDDVGVTGYFLSESAATPAATDAGWVGVPAASAFAADVPFTLSPETTPGITVRTVHAWFKDAAGNVSDGASDSIELAIADTTAPADGSVLINGGDAETASVNVTLTLSANDDMGVSGWLASTSASTPAPGDSGWQAVDPAEAFFSTDAAFTLPPAPVGTTTMTVHVWYRDEAGNVSSAATDTIDLVVTDDTPPAPVGITIDGGAAETDVTGVTVSLSASDDTGVAGYLLSNSPTTPASDDAGWVDIGAAVTPYSADVPHVIDGTSTPGSHTRTVYAWFRDAAGNVSAAASDTISFVVADTAAPVASALSINAGAGLTTDPVVSLSLAATDDGEITAFAVSESSLTPADNDSAWQSVAPATAYSGTASFTLDAPTMPGDYPATVYAWFRDAAGNVSASITDGITLRVLDTTAPAPSGIAIDGGANVTFETTVTVDIGATDDVDVAGWYLSESSTAPSAGDGGWTVIDPALDSFSATVAFTLTGSAVPGTFPRVVYAWFKDSTGNVSSAVSDTISLEVSDVTAPTPAAVLINAGDNATGTTSVTVDLSATDDAGVTAYFLAESSTAPAAGDPAWQAVSPAQANYAETVNFTLTGAVTPGEHTRTVHAWFRDAAGNISASVSDSIQLVVADTTEPGAASLVINNDDSETTTTSISLALAASDDVGVAGYYISESATEPLETAPGWVVVDPAPKNYSATIAYTVTGAAVPGSHTRTVHAWFKDAAGNISLAASDSIQLVVADTTAPDTPFAEIDGGAGTTADTIVSVSLSATDDVGVAAYFMSESSVTPLAAAAGWTTIDPAPVTYAATVTHTITGSTIPGTHSRTLYVWFKDAAGNVSVAAADSIDLIVADTTAPQDVGVLIDNGSASTGTTDVSLALSATDDDAVTAYYAASSAVTPAATDAGWSPLTPSANLSTTVAHTLTGSATPGTYPRTVYVWFKDAAGNVSAAAADSIDLVVADTTAPVSPSVLIDNGSAATTTTDVSLALSAADDVSVTAYYVSQGATTPAASHAGWSAVTPAATLSVSVSFTINGAATPGTYTRTVYAWFKDAAGNVSAAATDSIDLVVADTTAPTSVSSLINGDAVETTTTAVTVDLAATDDVAVTAYYLSESSATPDAAGLGWSAVSPATANYAATVNATLTGSATPGTHTRTVYAWFKDAAGNVSAAAADSIDLVVADTTAPASPVVTIDAGAAETTTTNVTLDLSATDDVAVTAYYITESSTTPAATAAGWTAVTPSASFSAATGFAITAASVPGTHTRTVYAWYKDAAGNVSAAASDSINLVVADTTAPVPGSASINSGAGTTSATSVNVSLSASDDVAVTAYFLSESPTTPTAGSAWSAVTPAATYSATVAFTLTGETVPGTYPRTVYAWFKDAAGNISAPVTDGIDLVVADTTAPASPAVSIDGGAADTTTTDVTLALSATDNVGVTGYFVSESSATPAATGAGWTAVTEAPAYGADVPFTITGSATPGTFTRTVYVWFKDSAGNVSAAAQDSINLVVADTAAPVTPSILIDGGALSTTTTSVSLALSATDDKAVTGYYVSESAATPAATDAGWTAVTAAASFSATAAFTLSGSTVPGTFTRTVYAWYKDAAGNVSAAASDSIDLVIVDSAAPVVSSVFIDGGAATTTVTLVTVSLAGTDDIGITGYFLSENTATPAATDPAWVVLTPAKSVAVDAPFSISSSNKVGTFTRTVNAWFRDDAGNVSPMMSDSIDFNVNDATEPSVDSVVLEGGANSVVGLTVTVDFTVSDDTGVVAYYISESMTDPLPSDAGWVSITSSATYSDSVLYDLDSTSTQRRRTVYVWSMDATGNVSRNGKDGINVN